MCVFTTVFDFAENVFVVMQVAVEDETHGELGEDKTQLMRKREKTGTHVFVSADVMLFFLKFNTVLPFVQYKT